MTVMQRDTWLKRERVLVQCLRWLSEKDSTFARDLAAFLAAQRRTHGTLAVRYDAEGNVIPGTEDEEPMSGKRAREGEDDEPEAKRQRVERQAVDALYTELFAQPQAPWSALLTMDAKEHIFRRLLDMAAANDTVTEFFTVLAMQHLSKGDVGGGRDAILRYGPEAPSFSFIARLIDENASLALFAWALWVYTGNTTAPATYLSLDELAEVAYHIVRYDRPAFLDPLLLGMPRRTQAAGFRGFRPLFDVLLPLALVKARYAGWDDCAVMQWIATQGEWLRALLLTDAGEVAYQIRVDAALVLAISGRSWTLRGPGGANIAWYAITRDDAQPLGFVPEGERGPYGLPLHALQWLFASGVADKTMPATSGIETFVAAVQIDSVAKASFLVEHLPGNVQWRDFFLENKLPGYVHLPVHARLDILDALITRSDRPLWSVFGRFVPGAIFVYQFDVTMADAMWSRYRELVPNAPLNLIKEVCGVWGAALTYHGGRDTASGVCVLLGDFIRTTRVNLLVRFFDHLGDMDEPMDDDTDHELAEFMFTVQPPANSWRATLAAVEAATYQDANGADHLCLPLTVEAVRRRLGVNLQAEDEDL